MTIETALFRVLLDTGAHGSRDITIRELGFFELSPDGQGTNMKPVREPSCAPMRISFASGDIPKSAKQPSERRFDEEALARMDDEGGSNDPAVNSPDAAKKAAPGG